MKLSDISRINTLHITSWDEDHCKEKELQAILSDLKPRCIEYPSYTPHTNNGKNSLKLIRGYDCEKRPIDSDFVNGQSFDQLLGVNLFYNPLQIVEKSNDNSIVKFFRIGSFQILSLGDCESEEIRDFLMNDDILKSEVDILILAHHGADNGFTTKEFFQTLEPKVAICASDYDNQYGHPAQTIVNRLRNFGIDYYSTKTGDIIAQSVDKYKFKVSNCISNNEEKKSVQTYKNKTYYSND